MPIDLLRTIVEGVMRQFQITYGRNFKFLKGNGESSSLEICFHGGRVGAMCLSNLQRLFNCEMFVGEGNELWKFCTHGRGIKN